MFFIHCIAIIFLMKIKSQQKYESPKTESKKSNYESYYGLISIVVLCAFLYRKCNDNKPRQNFNNEIKVPRVNPTFSLPPYSPTNNYFGFE